MKLKSLDWIGSSKKDFLKFPDDIKRDMGYVYLAQTGEYHENTKPLKGFGSSGIREIIEGDESGTYRTVYTVEIDQVVYVLHAFQKKSKHGISTPKSELDLIKKRLKRAFEEGK